MAVSRAKKVEQVEKLGAELKNVSSLIIATYSKLTVTQDFELRKTLRSSGAKYRVVRTRWPSWPPREPPWRVRWASFPA